MVFAGLASEQNLNLMELPASLTNYCCMAVRIMMMASVSLL